MNELLFLLLPFAFYSGWKAARNKFNSNQKKQRELSGHFVKGVNYLLSEEPDKALEVFLNYPDIDEYTAETYQLLGNLFRNRGEVDRALRVHQNLIARPNIRQEQKHKAMFSLGQDFFAAGMLDRAESVFQELLNDSNVSKNISKSSVCKSLRVIYEQTQEWEKAIETTSCSSKSLIESTVNNKNKSKDNALIAHYYCELANEALQKGKLHDVDLFMAKAKKAHKKSTRLMCLAGDIAYHQEKYQYALDHYLTAIKQGSRLLGMLFDKLEKAAIKVDAIPRLQSALLKLYQQKKNKVIFEYIVLLAIKNNDSSDVINMLINTELASEKMSVKSICNASEYFIQNSTESNPQETNQKSQSEKALKLVNTSLNNYLQGSSAFCCLHCGYKMRDFLWRCPACHHWDTIDHT